MTTFLGLLLATVTSVALIPYPLRPVSPILYRGDTHTAAQPVLYLLSHPDTTNATSASDSLRTAAPDSTKPTSSSKTP